MRVRVLFFGQVKEVVGKAEEAIEVAGGADLKRLFELYTERYPALAGLGRSMAMARNQHLAGASTPLADGDEIAFLPPGSGGCGRTPRLG